MLSHCTMTPKPTSYARIEWKLSKFSSIDFDSLSLKLYKFYLDIKCLDILLNLNKFLNIFQTSKDFISIKLRGMIVSFTNKVRRVMLYTSNL
jgi:hypothetical protein